MEARSTLVCIVDDDKSIRESLCDLVNSLGFETATFASAEDYLQSGCIETSSCLILDVCMPGMNGIDLQAHLLADGRRTPIIFITSFSDENMRLQALKDGAFGYLTKPFDEHELVACLNSVLARSAGQVQ